MLRARTKLAAWDALAQRVANLDAYSAKEQTAILALALRYAGDHDATSVQTQSQERHLAQVAAQVRSRLDGLGARLPELGLTPRPQLTPVYDDEPVDAELVWPTRAELH